MSDYREGCNYAKSVKAGIIEPKPVGGKSKRPAPVVLYGFWRGFRGNSEWVKIGAYRTEEVARNTAILHARKYDSFYLRFRIGNDGEEFDPRAASLSTQQENR